MKTGKNELELKQNLIGYIVNFLVCIISLLIFLCFLES